MLTNKQARFAIEYPVDSNATKAAERAGYSAATAYSAGSRLLDNVEILEAIEEQKKRIAAAALVTPALVLRELVAIATCDHRQFTQSRRGCCRYCWGIDHKREWMEHEYSTALNEALLNNFLPPAFEGGLGYSPTRKPNAECPKCAGEGMMRTWVVDARDLDSESAKSYMGVKQTKDGIEVKSADKIKAVELLGRYMGMFTDKSEVSGPGGGPIQLEAARAQELNDDQLMALAIGGSSAPLLLAENL